MKLYIAGPMSGYPLHNFPAFHRAAAEVRRLGHAVINPAETFGGRDDLLTSDYARYDISALLQVEGLVLLSGWSDSVGAKTEVAVAHWLGLSFWFLNQFGELTRLTPANACAKRYDC